MKLHNCILCFRSPPDPDPFEMMAMTPHDIDTKMFLFDQVNIKNEGTVLFSHDHETENDIVNATAIELIPHHISTITFLTHGAKFGDVEYSTRFWKTLAEKLVMDVSTKV